MRKVGMAAVYCCVAISLLTLVYATTSISYNFNESQIKPKQVPLKPTSTSKPMEPGVLLFFGVGLLVLPAFRRLNRHPNLKL